MSAKWARSITNLLAAARADRTETSPAHLHAPAHVVREGLPVAWR